MNPSDPLASLMEKTANEVRRYGATTWQRADDWRRVERITNDSSRGGGVGTARTDKSIEDRREDDEASRRLDELNKLHKRLTSDMRRLRWFIADANRDKPPLERVSTVAACIVCTGPAIQPRRGMCDACRKAWERADKPDLTVFKRDRSRQLEEARQVIHEHEVA